MYKSSLLTMALLSIASSAIASTQTVNLSPKAAHTLDLKSQGCTVEKAFFGDPSAAQYLEVNLDQPQPRTQKITLRWKAKPDTDGVFLQLHLQGCSQDYAQISIRRVDAPPTSPVTYINTSIVQSPVVPTVSTAPRPALTSTVSFPTGQKVATGKPLTLNLTGTPPRHRGIPTPTPKTVQRPPVRRSSFPNQPKPALAANGSQSETSITPSTILRGLNIARSKGEIGYRSDMHYRVNGMIRAMRRGSKPKAASQQAGVPASVVMALIRYSQL
ncbi:hypothetical protein [Acaryochloris sp. 'Moss Beach']|uniref:hypothetical protein n=1 Tax=Acaryochloris sp. 'Moss Beach' TaxID=2740837 RepID=UPI001F1B0B83|nr:hypothetical protein [Acaryochloris sp. 'Moss Beach']